jgi:hypothetical protein
MALIKVMQPKREKNQRRQERDQRHKQSAQGSHASAADWRLDETADDKIAGERATVLYVPSMSAETMIR